MTTPMRSPVSVAVPKATVARYRLRPAVRNCERRVALPITTGNTPVANGSSVPVCPTLRLAWQPSTYRRHDVVRRHAFGLVDDEDAVEGGDHLRASRSSGSSVARTDSIGSVDVKPLAFMCPPPPKRCATARTSTVALRAQADAGHALFVAAQQAHRADVLRRERQVDQAFGLVRRRASARVHVWRQREHREPAAGLQLHAVQQFADQAHASEAELS